MLDSDPLLKRLASTWLPYTQWARLALGGSRNPRHIELHFDFQGKILGLQEWPSLNV